MGRYLDFHMTQDDTSDYAIRLYVDSSSLFHVNSTSIDGRLVIGASKGSSTTPIYTNSDGIATACSEMMPKSGSTFSGAAYAYTNTDYTTYQLRNIAFTTSVPSSLTNGYICMVYS